LNNEDDEYFQQKMAKFKPQLSKKFGDMLGNNGYNNFKKIPTLGNENNVTQGGFFPGRSNERCN
jgi:hypothetical protein